MYNILGELSALIISCLFFFITVKSFYLKDRRNLLFLLCDISIIFSTFTDILSCHMISNFEKYSLTLCTAVTTLFFIFLTIIPFLICLYCYASINSVHKFSKLYHTSVIIIYITFLFFVFANLRTGWIFYYDRETGYHRGIFKNITYILTFFYIVITEFTVFKHRKFISSRMFNVFVIYPIVSLIIILIQFFIPEWLMSGMSGVIILTLLYTVVQSEKIEIDYKTGLRTETSLARILPKKKSPYTITLISFENYNFLVEKIGISDLDLALYPLIMFLKSHVNGKLFIDHARLLIKAPRKEFNENVIRQAFYQYGTIKKTDNTEIEIEYLVASVTMFDDASSLEEMKDIFSTLLIKGKQQNATHFLYCTDLFMKKYKRGKQILKILERELNPDSEQYQVYFQPIFSIPDNKFLYAEALSRLVNTELDPQPSPSEFIPIAETYGLINKLGRLNFEKVCQFISKNKDTVKAVSINFSVFQMTSPDIEEFVLGTINKYGIKPENIIMEITESIVIEDYALVRQRMEFFSRAGINFYLDDFGTGYSNFANVIRLPFSTIKIDRTFVLEMEKDEGMVKLVTNLISTFKDSNLKILVEGVENETQDNLVKSAGADYIQGFKYSRPVPGIEYLEVLKNQ